MFPTEQSLSNLDSVLSDMKCQIGAMDEEMRRVVRGQTSVGDEASASLEDAQASIIQLFVQIKEIKAKAAESESMVRDITSDIKQLDTAKRNLTLAITTLNHLHMLVGGVSTLRQQTKERQYGDAANLLQVWPLTQFYSAWRANQKAPLHWARYWSLSFLPATSSSRSRTLKELFEVMRRPFRPSTLHFAMLL